ncbi:MAG: hypothetical protein WCL18_09895 [bacterium]
MLIIIVLKNNRNLHEHSYYLGVAEYLLKEANEQLKKAERLCTIDRRIQEIEKYIDIAIDKYNAEDPSTLKHVQKNGFHQKKETIKERLAKFKKNVKRKKRRLGVE